MADELHLLRGANPVSADDPRWQDGPLDARAEQLLLRITSARPPREVPRRPGVRRGLPWAAASACACAALALALALTGPGAAPAVAAPLPLKPVTGSVPIPLSRLAAATHPAGSRLVHRSHVQSWSLGVTVGSDTAPPITLPEERIVEWKADGSETELVVATDPRHPGRPVISDAGGDGAPRIVSDGHVISRQTYPPSWSDAAPFAAPPTDPAELLSYLRELDRDAAADPAALLDAVSTLLDNWTPGADQSAALLHLVAARIPALRPIGAITDRLGRSGQAYTVDVEAHSLRYMLIVDPVSGAILGLEFTAISADPELGIAAGAVWSYRAWMR